MEPGTVEFVVTNNINNRWDYIANDLFENSETVEAFGLLFKLNRLCNWVGKTVIFDSEFGLNIVYI